MVWLLSIVAVQLDLVQKMLLLPDLLLLLLVLLLLFVLVLVEKCSLGCLADFYHLTTWCRSETHVIKWLRMVLIHKSLAIQVVSQTRFVLLLQHSPLAKSVTKGHLIRTTLYNLIYFLYEEPGSLIDIPKEIDKFQEPVMDLSQVTVVIELKQEVEQEQTDRKAA